MNRIKSPLILCIVGLAVLTWADLWTKNWASDHLSQESGQDSHSVCQPDEKGRIYPQRIRHKRVILIENYLEFRYTENCGAAFGLLNKTPGIFRSMLFMTAVVVAVIVFMWLFVRGKGGPLFALSVPFIISGALGNAIDRIQNGYVVDFIRFHIYHYFEWPTFNIADLAITFGVILLFLDGFRKQEATQKSHQEEMTEQKESSVNDPSTT